MQGTIVIADSSPVFRHGLEQILLKRGIGATIVHAESGKKLQAVLTPNAPELVIIDCMAPKFSVDDVLACQRVHPGLKMLAITAAHSGQSIVHALRAGITSYVKKDCSMEEVLEAIDETSAGGTFFCGQILAAIEADSISVDDLESADASCDPIVLSNREIEVLTLISVGLTNVQIAEKLFLSSHTVNTHRKNIMQKLRVNNTAAMVMYAVKSGFVSPNRFLFHQ
jgi:DNA-binding NarL/FixJ family response regulator